MGALSEGQQGEKTQRSLLSAKSMNQLASKSSLAPCLLGNLEHGLRPEVCDEVLTWAPRLLSALQSGDSTCRRWGNRVIKLDFLS